MIKITELTHHKFFITCEYKEVFEALTFIIDSKVEFSMQYYYDNEYIIVIKKDDKKLKEKFVKKWGK